MAFADFDDYIEKLKLNRVADFQMSIPVGTAFKPMAMWRLFVPAPATPTTSTALDKTSPPAIGPIPDSSTGKLCAIGARMSVSGLAGANVTLIDLLNHSGGLDATVATQQTTNLPTAALTRHTSGEGVMAAIIIYTQLGSTSTTLTAKYTNQNGTANQVTTAIPLGGTTNREINRLILLPLAAGDTGVRSVESVTLAASTGIAGNFGVVLFKPLTTFALENTAGAMPIDAISSGGMIGSFQEFDDDACLSCMAITATVQSINGAILLAEI